MPDHALNLLKNIFKNVILLFKVNLD